MKNLLGDRPNLETLEPFHRLLCSFVPETELREKKVLDVGCGFGWFCLFAKSCGAQQVVGVEPSSEDLETAKQAIGQQVSLQAASALALPFRDDYFDTVASWEVIEHIPRNSEPRYFSEIARVLRPGGSFYLSTPFASLVSQLLDPAWLLIGHRHYSEETLRLFAQDVGMNTMGAERRGGVVTGISHLNMYVSKWLFRRPPMFDKRFRQWVEKDLRKPNGRMSLIMHFRKRAAAAH